MSAVGGGNRTPLSAIAIDDPVTPQPVSPTAAELASINAKARHGDITPARKAQMKDHVIRKAVVARKDSSDDGEDAGIERKSRPRKTWAASRKSTPGGSSATPLRRKLGQATRVSTPAAKLPYGKLQGPPRRVPKSGNALPTGGGKADKEPASASARHQRHV